MNVPSSASEVLRIWEEVGTYSPLQRAVALASLGSDAEGRESLMRRPVGERDARLLMLRQQWFGDDMDCVARCPDCGQTAEFTVKASDFLVRQRSDQSCGISLSVDECEIILRCPTSEDLIGILTEGSDPGRAKKQLLRRCVEVCHKMGVPQDVSDVEWSEVVEQRVLEVLEQHDPLAVVDVSVSCQDCARRWDAPFDIGTYLWSDLQRWAKRLLQDVHVLASAYGWCEADILAMSSYRRAHYLQMVMG